MPVRSRGRRQCPDPDSYVFLGYSASHARMRYSSYAGCAGAWFNTQFGTVATGARTASSTPTARPSSPRSRMGRATRSCSPSTPCTSRTRRDQICWHWWTSGNYGDTIFTTFLPINPQKKLPVRLHRRRRARRTRRRGLEHASRRGECRPLRRLGPVRQGDDQLLAECADEPRDSSRDDPHSVLRSLAPAATRMYWTLAAGTQVRRLAAARHPQRRRSRQLRLLLILELPEDSWAASRSRGRGAAFVR